MQFGAEIVPTTDDFEIGYFRGQQKLWIRTDDDVKDAWSQLERGVGSLWFHGVNKPAISDDESDDETPIKRRRLNKSSSVTENKHKRIEDIKQKLLEKHGSEYSPMQYRLWAEMIAIGTHSSYDLPPRIPMFTGGRTIKPKTHTSDLTVALTTMAEAVTGALKPKEVSTASTAVTTAVTTTVTAVPCCSSPGKIADVRSKYIQQLRELHSLYEIGALTETEFTEQKLPVLEQLKKFKL